MLIEASVGVESGAKSRILLGIVKRIKSIGKVSQLHTSMTKVQSKVDTSSFRGNIEQLKK